MDNNQWGGKKVFFLRPHSVIHQKMLDTLLMAGYEVYLLQDNERARKLLAKFPDSIMFVNIDEGYKEAEWEDYIKIIQKDPKTRSVRLGIMSYNQDKELMQKYLMEMMVPCGYIQLKLGLQESTNIILSALEANEARGKRQFIRAVCEDDLNATLNYRGDLGMYHGKILDISSAGIAVRMKKSDILPPNTVIKDVQIKVRGGLVLTDMILMGIRKDKQVNIFLFDPKMSEENKIIIYRYIKMCLQKYIDELKV
jgi:hypothetical protein